MDNLLGTAQQGMEQLREIYLWVTGLTGGTGLVAALLLIKAGSLVLRTIAKIVLVIVVVALAIWAYLYFGLDAYFDILPILGIG